MTWVVVPFANSFEPGPKTFDIVLNQVTYTTDRTQTADLSDGYFFGPQTVVALKASKYATAKTIADLQSAKFGVQVGTTSYDAITNVIKPTTDTAVFDTNDAAIAGPQATSRSTPSSSTCRPRPSSRTSSSTDPRSSASSTPGQPSTSARSCPRAAP